MGSGAAVGFAVVAVGAGLVVAVVVGLVVGLIVGVGLTVDVGRGVGETAGPAVVAPPVGLAVGDGLAVGEAPVSLDVWPVEPAVVSEGRLAVPVLVASDVSAPDGSVDAGLVSESDSVGAELPPAAVWLGASVVPIVTVGSGRQAAKTSNRQNSAMMPRWRRRTCAGAGGNRWRSRCQMLDLFNRLPPAYLILEFKSYSLYPKKGICRKVARPFADPPVLQASVRPQWQDPYLAICRSDVYNDCKVRLPIVRTLPILNLYLPPACREQDYSDRQSECGRYTSFRRFVQHSISGGNL